MKKFTFIEILATLAIIGIAMVPLLKAFIVGAPESIESRYAITGFYLAQEKIEFLKMMPFSRVVSDIEIYQSIYDETFQPEYKLCDEDAAEFTAKFSDVFTERFYKKRHSDYEKIYQKFRKAYKDHFKFDDGFSEDEIDDYELYPDEFYAYRRITEVSLCDSLDVKDSLAPVPLKKVTVRVFLKFEKDAKERKVAELTTFIADI